MQIKITCEFLLYFVLIELIRGYRLSFGDYNSTTALASLWDHPTRFPVPELSIEIDIPIDIVFVGWKENGFMAEVHFDETLDRRVLKQLQSIEVQSSGDLPFKHKLLIHGHHSRTKLFQRLNNTMNDFALKQQRNRLNPKLIDRIIREEYYDYGLFHTIYLLQPIHQDNPEVKKEESKVGAQDIWVGDLKYVWVDFATQSGKKQTDDEASAASSISALVYEIGISLVNPPLRFIREKSIVDVITVPVYIVYQNEQHVAESILVSRWGSLLEMLERTCPATQKINVRQKTINLAHCFECSLGWAHATSLKFSQPKKTLQWKMLHQMLVQGRRDNSSLLFTEETNSSIMSSKTYPVFVFITQDFEDYFSNDELPAKIFSDMMILIESPRKIADPSSHNQKVSKYDSVTLVFDALLSSLWGVQLGYLNHLTKTSQVAYHISSIQDLEFPRIHSASRNVAYSILRARSNQLQKVYSHFHRLKSLQVEFVLSAELNLLHYHWRQFVQSLDRAVYFLEIQDFTLCLEFATKMRSHLDVMDSILLDAEKRLNAKLTCQSSQPPPSTVKVMNIERLVGVALGVSYAGAGLYLMRTFLSRRL